jgi:hypothetical protein
MLKLTMRRSLVWISVSGYESEGQGWLMEHQAAASSVLPDVVRLARYGPRPLSIFRWRIGLVIPVSCLDSFVHSRVNANT